jgi:hypothetical protein
MNRLPPHACLALLASIIAVAGCDPKSEPQTVQAPENHGESSADLGARFNKATGLAWPHPVKVIKSGESGTSLHMLIETDDAVLAEWIKNSPPWNCKEWQRGPIPEQVGLDAGMQCMDKVGYRKEGDPKGYRGSGNDIVAILNQTDVYFAAKVDEAKAPAWAERGKVLVIDKAAKRAWLSVWEP